MEKEYESLEEFIPVNSDSLNLLRKNMEENPKLKQRLAISNAIENPYYKYFVRETAPIMWKHEKLFNIIIHAMKLQEGFGFELYFCKTEEKITTLIAYFDRGDTIDGLKIISFYDEERMNIAIAVDLANFLDKKIKTHSAITWEALKENPAVFQYNKICIMFGLDIPEKESEGYYIYTLEKERYTSDFQKNVETFLVKHGK
jgi:hypothetical protein